MIFQMKEKNHIRRAPPLFGRVYGRAWPAARLAESPSPLYRPRIRWMIASSPLHKPISRVVHLYPPLV